MRDTIAWSYELLLFELPVAFRSIGVFAGGADLEAVGAVAMTMAGRDVLDTVAELLDAGLLTIAEEPGGEPRVLMLQTVADFAIDRLTHEGEHDDARLRHAEHYLGVAKRLCRTYGPATHGRAPTAPGRRRQLPGGAQLVLQGGSGATPPPQQARLGLRLCAALQLLWSREGFAPDVRRWCQRALDLDSGDDSRERSRVHLALALAYQDLPPNDPWRRQLLEESLAISRRVNDPEGITLGLVCLAEELAFSDEFDTATDLAEQAARVAVRCAHPRYLGIATRWRGAIEAMRGNFLGAIDLLGDSQRLARDSGDEAGAAVDEIWIAECLADVGRAEEAHQRLRQIAADVLRISQPRLSIVALAAGAHVYAVLGDAQRAATLLGAQWALWTTSGQAIEPISEEAWMQQTRLAAAREELGKGGGRTNPRRRHPEP